jgi:hypothetical protein
MGWVNVPPQGKMYGKKYIAHFADDTIAIYVAGKNDKSKRTGPPSMLKALARKYSDGLDLPAETEIRQSISKLMAQDKEGNSLSMKPKYKGLHPHHTRLSNQFFIVSGGAVMPTARSKEFLQKHPVPPPDDLIVDAGSYPSEKDGKKGSLIYTNYTGPLVNFQMSQTTMIATVSGSKCCRILRAVFIFCCFHSILDFIIIPQVSCRIKK